MNGRTWARNSRLWVAVAILATLALLVGGFIANSSTTATNPTDQVATATQDPTATQVATKWAKAAGFTKGEFVVDNIDPNLPGATSNRGGAFNHEPLLTEQDLQEFLASDAHEAEEARLLLGDMEGVTWISVQFTVPVILPGNTIIVNGEVIKTKPIRIPAGDVAWLAVRDGEVVAVVRGACANFQFLPPRPVKPPKKPPVKDVCHREDVKKPADYTAEKYQFNWYYCDYLPREVPPTPTPTPTPEPTPTPTPTPEPTPTPTPTPSPSCPNNTCPKGPVGAAPSGPASATPNPIGTASAPTRPAPPDAPPVGGVHDVNPPAVPAQPDSGSGATNTVAPSNVPVAPSAPAPAPSGTASGIVGSD